MYRLLLEAAVRTNGAKVVAAEVFVSSLPDSIKGSVTRPSVPTGQIALPSLDNVRHLASAFWGLLAH